MTEEYQDLRDLEVLRILRILGLAPTEALVARLRRDPAELAAHLRLLEGRSQVQSRRGRMSGWSITAEGRAHLSVLAAAEVRSSEVRDRLVACYQRFGPMNTTFLALCTDWQLRTTGPAQGREPVVNDHSDVDYDLAVIARLRAVDHEIHELLDDAAAVLERFDTYRRRLDHAVGQVESGALDWFTRPIIDSYHTVWFELHEDLLTTLGLERSDEH